MSDPSTSGAGGAGMMGADNRADLVGEVAAALRRSGSAMDDSIRVGDDRVPAGLLWSGLASYALREQEVLRRYDQVADGGPVAAERIDITLIGRVLFADPALSAADASWLLDAQIADLLEPIAADAKLVEAEPELDGGLYDQAELVHRALIGDNRRISSTTVSAALALLRPGLFPILSAPTRTLYREAAERAWQQSHKARRPFSKRTFWPVIREDVLANAGAIAAWREQLSAGSVPEQWLARVTDVRLWGIALGTLAAGTMPGTR